MSDVATILIFIRDVNMGMISNLHPWFCFWVDSLFRFLVYSCFFGVSCFYPFPHTYLPCRSRCYDASIIYCLSVLFLG